MKKKVLSILAAVTMTVVLIAGCGGAAPTQTTTKGTSSTTKAEITASATTKAATSATTAVSTTTAAAAKTNGSSYHFEIIAKGFQSTFWQAVKKGAESKAKELGVTINFNGPNSSSDIADQVNMLSNAISAKPDGIGFAAIDTKACMDLINQAVVKGIPIIGFNSGVPGAPEGAIKATASTDNYAAGKNAADHLYDKIKDKIKNAKSSVRIGDINHDATSDSICNRGLGFIDELAEKITADGKKVAVIGNDFYVGKTKAEKTEQSSADVIIEVRVPSQVTAELCATEATVILNESDTIAIYGSSQDAIEGIITADGNLGVLGCDDSNITAVGFDSGSVLKTAIKDGTVYGAVTQAPVAQGEQVVQLLYDVASGKEVKNVDTGNQWYDKDTIDKPEIAQNLYD